MRNSLVIPAFLTMILASAPAALALNVPAQEVANKIREVALRAVRFEGQDKTILTDSRGLSLYTFDRDSAGKNVQRRLPAGMAAPLEVDASTPLPAPFGRIQGNNGRPQLTLHGLPLYFFNRDKTPGDVNGHYPEWQLIFVEN